MTTKYIVIMPKETTKLRCDHYFKAYMCGPTPHKGKAGTFTAEQIDKCCAMYEEARAEKPTLYGAHWLAGCKLRVVV